MPGYEQARTLIGNLLYAVGSHLVRREVPQKMLFYRNVCFRNLITFLVIQGLSLLIKQSLHSILSNLISSPVHRRSLSLHYPREAWSGSTTRHVRRYRANSKLLHINCTILQRYLLKVSVTFLSLIAYLP